MTEQKPLTTTWRVVGTAASLAALLGFGAAWMVKPKDVSPPTAAPVVAAEPGTPEIKIPAEYLTAANIVVEPVLAGSIVADVLAPATVTALPNAEATVVARAAGTLTRVNRRLGDTVKAGDVLAVVDSQEAATMFSDRSVAIAKAELARKAYTREAGLFEQGVTPRQEMEAAQSALAVAEAEVQRASSVARAAHLTEDGRSVAVVSPIGGKVTAASAMLGSYIQPQAELFRVVGYGAVQIEAAVTAADSGRITVGDKASILLARGAPIDAVVHSITPTVSGATRAATVVLTPITSDRSLVIGEGVQVRLHGKGSGGGFAVPEDAVQNVDGRDVLFVRTPEGFRPQPVLVGNRSGGMAQIVSGVEAGVPVATRNAFLIKADMIKSAKEE